MAYRLIGITSIDATQTSRAVDALNLILNNLQNQTSLPFKNKIFSHKLEGTSKVVGSDSKTYKAIRSHRSLSISGWAASTTYKEGDLVFPSIRGGYYFEAQNQGASGSSEPSFESNMNATTVDNEITWKAMQDSQPISGKSYNLYWKETSGSGDPYTQNTQYYSDSGVYIDSSVLEVTSSYFRDSSGNDIQMEMISRNEFNGIYDKTEIGDPIKAFYDGMFSPQLHLWPVPEDKPYTIFYNAVTIFNDMDLGLDTGVSTKNFLNRWIMYLAYELAVHLGEEYQMKESKLIRLERKAFELKKSAMIRDGENITYRFTKGAY